ncbi:hypothetical protein LTS18_014693, partial [Coniosporium uncinatum]
MPGVFPEEEPLIQETVSTSVPESDASELLPQSFYSATPKGAVDGEREAITGLDHDQDQDQDQYYPVEETLQAAAPTSFQQPQEFAGRTGEGAPQIPAVSDLEHYRSLFDENSDETGTLPFMLAGTPRISGLAPLFHESTYQP